MKKYRLLIFIICAVITVWFLFEGLRCARRQGGYIEEREKFIYNLINYLDKYYQGYNYYPEKIEVSKFPVYQNKDYRDILDKIEYSTDGNCFELRWRYPAYLVAEPTIFIIMEQKWCEGKNVYQNYRTVEGSENNAVIP